MPRAKDRDRRLVLIVNPRAGIGSAYHLKDRILRELDGLEVQVRVLERGEDARVVAKEGIKDGATDIIAAGGDGTVSGVAGAMAGTDVSFGIIPTGTANMLARELGLPLSVSKAARLIADKSSLTGLDAMSVGDRSFVYQMVIGSGSEAASKITRDEKMVFGRTVYAIAGLRLLTDYHPIKVRGAIDGREFRMWAHQVIIANAGILGIESFRWGPNIRPDDGRVEVIAMRGRTRLSFLESGLDLMLGNYKMSRGLRYFNARREITLDSEPSTVVKADGEIAGHTPLKVEVRPAAIKVIVPRPMVQTGTRRPP